MEKIGKIFEKMVMVNEDSDVVAFLVKENGKYYIGDVYSVVSGNWRNIYNNYIKPNKSLMDFFIEKDENIEIFSI